MLRIKKLIMLVLILASASLLQAQQGSVPLKVGDEAPPIYIDKWIKGKPITKFEKGKVYLIDLSGIFCPGCVQIIPHLTELSRKYSGKAEVFVLYGAHSEDVEKFAKDMGDKMDYGIAADNTGRTFNEWRIEAIPACFVINQEGKIAYVGKSDLDAVLASVLKTGSYTPNAEKEEQLHKERIKRVARNRQLMSLKMDQSKLRRNGRYELSLHLLDSAMVTATDDEKYDVKSGLMLEKFQTALLMKDSVLADACLAEVMDHVPYGFWMYLQLMFNRMVSPTTGTSPRPFNYQRYLDIANRAANDAGEAKKAYCMIQQAKVMYGYDYHNKADAIDVLNQALKITEKQASQSGYNQDVKDAIIDIEEREKERLLADADWAELRKMQQQRLPTTEDFAKVTDDNYKKTFAYFHHMDTFVRRRMTMAEAIWKKYPQDRRRLAAFLSYLDPSAIQFVRWTKDIPPRLEDTLDKMAQASKDATAKYKEDGLKIYSSAPYRSYPRDFEAEAYWWRNVKEMADYVRRRMSLSYEQREIVDWNMFVAEWQQQARDWRLLPKKDERRGEGVTDMQSDYWKAVALHYWEGSWLRFTTYVEKYPYGKALADRALNFIQGTKSNASPEVALVYWQRILDTYADPRHPLADKPGIQAMCKKAQELLAIEAVESGEEAIDMKFTAMDGREVDLAKLRGKVVLIDFWATWCGPCVLALPYLKDMYDTYHSEGLEIISVSFDDEKMRDRVKQLIEKHNLPWPQRFEGKGNSDSYKLLYGVSGLPTLFLIGKDGKMIFREVGITKELEPMIRKKLGLGPDSNVPYLNWKLK